MLALHSLECYCPGVVVPSAILCSPMLHSSHWHAYLCFGVLHALLDCGSYTFRCFDLLYGRCCRSSRIHLFVSLIHEACCAGGRSFHLQFSSESHSLSSFRRSYQNSYWYWMPFPLCFVSAGEKTVLEYLRNQLHRLLRHPSPPDQLSYWTTLVIG